MKHIFMLTAPFSRNKRHCMKLMALFTALVISLSSTGQSGTWKEMNDFHDMVSKVLHPVESGNLQPLKNNSNDLLDKARKWQNAPAPGAYQYPQLKTDLEKLVADCTNLNEAVKAKKSNKEIKQLAMQTHNHFHVILSAAENKKK